VTVQKDPNHEFVILLMCVLCVFLISLDVNNGLISGDEYSICTVAFNALCLLTIDNIQGHVVRLLKD
jgi:hypothetical protein